MHLDSSFKSPFKGGFFYAEFSRVLKWSPYALSIENKIIITVVFLCEFLFIFSQKALIF